MSVNTPAKIEGAVDVLLGARKALQYIRDETLAGTALYEQMREGIRVIDEAITGLRAKP